MFNDSLTFSPLGTVIRMGDKNANCRTWTETLAELCQSCPVGLVPGLKGFNGKVAQPFPLSETLFMTDQLAQRYTAMVTEISLWK